MSRCFALMLALWPAVVLAGRPGPAALASSRALVVTPAKVATAPAALLRELGPDTRVLSREAFAAAIEKRSARRQLAAARAAQKAGARAVAELRRDEAQSALQAALRHFAGAQRLPGACGEAHAAARELTFLLWQRKQLARARRWRAAASELAASAQAIDPTRYQPAFIAFWKATDDARPIPITVAAKGAAAGERTTAWVNCRESTATPAAIAVKGAALVLISGRGRSAAAVIEPSSSQLHEIALPPAPGRASAEDATAVLGQREATVLLWLEADGKGWIVHRFTPAEGWQRAVQRIAADRPGVATSPAPSAATSASPPPDGERARPTLGWVLGGSAVALLATGAITAAVARSAGDEIERKAAAGEVFDPSDEQRNRVTKYTSYATFAVGGALAAAAVVYWIWWARRSPREHKAKIALTATGAAFVW